MGAAGWRQAPPLDRAVIGGPVTQARRPGASSLSAVADDDAKGFILNGDAQADLCGSTVQERVRQQLRDDQHHIVVERLETAVSEPGGRDPAQDSYAACVLCPEWVVAVAGVTRKRSFSTSPPRWGAVRSARTAVVVITSSGERGGHFVGLGARQPPRGLPGPAGHPRAAHAGTRTAGNHPTARRTRG